MECWICFRGQVDLFSWTSGTFEMEYTVVDFFYSIDPSISTTSTYKTIFYI